MATRERILMRDNGLCQCDRCKASGTIRVASQVDHRTPLWEGGTNDDANLQAISAECHALKTSEEAKRRGGRV